MLPKRRVWNVEEIRARSVYKPKHVVRCDAVHTRCDATILCNNFARWLQKIVATCAMCWVFWDAMIFCNNLARWLHKIVASMCDAMCVGFLRKLFWNAMIFCNNFALVRRNATRPRRSDAMRCIWCDAVLLCANKISRFTNWGTWSNAMRCIWSDAIRCIWSDAVPCGKQHLREIATPDWART